MRRLAGIDYNRLNLPATDFLVCWELMEILAIGGNITTKLSIITKHATYTVVMNKQSFGVPNPTVARTAEMLNDNENEKIDAILILDYERMDFSNKGYPADTMYSVRKALLRFAKDEAIL